MLGIATRNALARFRIFHEALPVIGDPAGVELVVEDSITAPSVAINRRGVPLASARAQDGLMIEARGDPAGAPSRPRTP